MGIADSSTGCCNQTLSLEDSFKESNHILKQQAKLRGLQPSTYKHGKMSTNYIHGKGSIDDYATTSASEDDYDEIEGSYDPDNSYSGDGLVILDPTLNRNKDQNKIPPAFSSNLSVSPSHSTENIQDELIANLNKQYEEKLNEHKLEAAMLQRENERLRQQNKLLKTKYSQFNEKHRNKNGHKNSNSLPLKSGKQYRARINSHPHPMPNLRGSKIGSKSSPQLQPSMHKRKSTPFKPSLRIKLPSDKNGINKSAPISLGQSRSTISRTPKHEPILLLHTENGKISYDSLHETQKSAPISADYYYNNNNKQNQNKRRSQVISPLVLPLPPLKESSFHIESTSAPLKLTSTTFAYSPHQSDNEEWIIHPDPHNDASFKAPLALTRSCSESPHDDHDASAQIEDHKNGDDNDNYKQCQKSSAIKFVFDIEFDGNCDSLINCVAIKRIIETLKWYSECNGNTLMLLHKIREHNYGYNLIKDYHHIMKKHLDSKCVDQIRNEIHKNVKQCKNTKKCGGYQRKFVEYQQNEQDKMENKRGRKRKRKNKDKKQDRHEHVPFYVECMDTIHCYFMHNLIAVKRV